MRFRDVVEEALIMAISDRWLVAGAFVMGALPNAYAATTMTANNAFRFSSLWGVVLLIPQVLITRRALAARNAMADPAARPNFVWRAVGQNILYSLGLVLGLLLLIIPGLVLFVRWSIVLPVLISRNCDVSDSLSISWALTGRNLPLAVTISVALLAAFGIGLVPVMFFGETPPALIAQEMLLMAAQISAWLMATSLYLALTEPDRAGAIATDIFA